MPFPLDQPQFRLVAVFKKRQNAKPQIISATVDLGINMIARNIFGAKKQTVTQFNPIPAPGAFETVIVNTMQPEQDNKEVRLHSFLGKVEVNIS